jgi:hypothetical protein
MNRITRAFATLLALASIGVFAPAVQAADPGEGDACYWVDDSGNVVQGVLAWDDSNGLHELVCVSEDGGVNRSSWGRSSWGR